MFHVVVVVLTRDVDVMGVIGLTLEMMWSLAPMITPESMLINMGNTASLFGALEMD